MHDAYSCPRCGYDQTGLPAEHVCPECGLDCDPHCQYIKLQTSRWHISQVIMGAAFLWLIVRVNGKRPNNTPDDWILPGVVLAAIIFHSLLSARQSLSDQYAIIDRHGVVLHLSPRRIRRFHWESISAARLTFVAGNFKLLDRRGRTLYRILATRLGTRATVRRLVREINRLSRIYAPNDDRSS